MSALFLYFEVCFTKSNELTGRTQTHGGHEAVVLVLVGKKNGVFDEDCAGSQDEGEEEVDVDVVPGAMELPVEQRKEQHVTAVGSVFQFLQIWQQ